MSEQPGPFAEPSPSRRAVSPLKAFAITAALLTLAATALYLSRENAPAETPNTPVGAPEPSPDPTLTDEAAIQTFTELHARGIQAVQSNSSARLGSVFTPDGSSGRRAARAIKDLAHNKVTDKTKSTILSAHVLENSGDTIVIRAAVIFEPCYITKNGLDVTKGPEKVRRVSDWTMRLEGTRWLIHDAVVRKQEPRSRQRARC